MNQLKESVKAVLRRVSPTFWLWLAELSMNPGERRQWDRRIQDALACPDNSRLKRVPDAGRIVGGCQIMHNGLRVLTDGYYGHRVTRMLKLNRGCHEPQEEVVFDAILPCLPPGAVMIEVGAYWAFYSMWMQKVVKGGRSLLIEPSAGSLEVGRANFKLNGFTGDFTHAYVGEKPGLDKDGTPVVSIGSFVEQHRLARIHLLHADIQGAEMDMLRGTDSLLRSQRIDYLFISTHSEPLHDECALFLQDRRYRVLVSISLQESYCWDGVLVACAPHIEPPAFPHPSRKPRREPEPVTA
jgi:hypothetical protein